MGSPKLLRYQTMYIQLQFFAGTILLQSKIWLGGFIPNYSEDSLVALIQEQA
jgi:hypothetical protein